MLCAINETITASMDRFTDVHITELVNNTLKPLKEGLRPSSLHFTQHLSWMNCNSTKPYLQKKSGNNLYILANIWTSNHHSKCRLYSTSYETQIKHDPYVQCLLQTTLHKHLKSSTQRAKQQQMKLCSSSQTHQALQPNNSGYLPGNSGILEVTNIPTISFLRGSLQLQKYIMLTRWNTEVICNITCKLKRTAKEFCLE